VITLGSLPSSGEQLHHAERDENDEDGNQQALPGSRHELNGKSVTTTRDQKNKAQQLAKVIIPLCLTSSTPPDHREASTPMGRHFLQRATADQGSILVLKVYFAEKSS
jgi:hypothetical protein